MKNCENPHSNLRMRKIVIDSEKFIQYQLKCSKLVNKHVKEYSKDMQLSRKHHHYKPKAIGIDLTDTDGVRL